MSNIDNSIEKIKSASPLELPYVIMETELHDKKTSYEIYEEVSKTFEGEGIIDNVVTPVLSTVVDSVLAMKCFKGVSRKRDSVLSGLFKNASLLIMKERLVFKVSHT